MKLLFTFLALLVCRLGLTQNDLIVINKDSIKCNIIENGMDTIFFHSYKDGRFYHITSNSIDVDSQYVQVVDYKIGLVHFYQSADCDFTTQDLLEKLDFSSGSPNIKSVRDYSNYPSYMDVIDTVNNIIYWFGLDFSRVKTRLGRDSRTLYTELFFADCNDFMLSANGITNFRKHFNFIIDTGIVTNQNNRINLSNIYNKQRKILSLDSIRLILRDFKTVHKGIGLIVFVTSLNKELETITYYTTFFDLRTKTVLLCLKEIKKTRGIGMVYHWTKPIIETLDFLITKESWKKRYLFKH